MKTGSNSRGGGRPMTPAAASRIQSATARASGGQVRSGSFAGRAQAAAAHNASGGDPAGYGKAGN
jgi:hypothetical protein